MVHTISTSDITMVLWYIVWYCIVHSMVPQTYHGTYPIVPQILPWCILQSRYCMVLLLLHSMVP